MPTQLNTYIASAKTHAIELASDLGMIASDLGHFMNDPEAMSKTALNEEGMMELIKNVKAMAGSATFLGREIGERLDRLIQEESMSDLREEIRKQRSKSL